MAKRKGGKQQPIPQRPTVAPPLQLTPAPAAVQQMILGYNPSSPVKPVDIMSSTNGWSEFVLEDKTVVRVKGVLVDVKKVVGEYAPDGKPVYLLQMTVVPDVIVPPELMKQK
jgi:hypothetical protein